MGLEAGWNCHISLLNDSDEKSQSRLNVGQSNSSFRPTQYSSSSLRRASREEQAQKLSQNAEATRRSSAPGAIHLDIAQVI